jgi:phage tail sheath gpL-like
MVSDEPWMVPDIRFIYSKGVSIQPGPEAAETCIPSAEDIRIISGSEAKKLFGAGAQIMGGVTVHALFFADHTG